MQTVAIIPARGGSKGIPRKNIIDFCGHPLLCLDASAVAAGCRQTNGVFVSTDDPEISAVSRRYGAEVIVRPPELSTDTADSESAVIHALDVVEAGGRAVDAVLFLQATSPLREPAELEGALAKFEGEKLDSLFSGAELEHRFIWQEADGRLQSWNYDFRHRKRRQDLSGQARQYIETGSFYITRPQLLRETRNRLGGRIGVWPVPFWKNFEIDSIEDLHLCGQLMKLHHLDRPPPEPA